MMEKADAPWFPKSIAGGFFFKTLQTRWMSLQEVGKLTKIVFQEYPQIIHRKKGRTISFPGDMYLFRNFGTAQIISMLLCSRVR
jgi:hypothetical protein